MKKAISFAAAAALALGQAASPAFFTSVAADDDYTQFPLTVEAETLDGNVYMHDYSDNTDKPWTSIYGELISNGEYSGEGFAYVQGNTISMAVNVPEDAMYQIDLKATFLNGTEGSSNMETIAINGKEYTAYIGYSTEWQDFSFGKVRLSKGENLIEFIGAKYGYYEIDTITISEAEFPDFSAASVETCDPDATAETKSLMNYLHSVYGTHILSGQQQIYGGGNYISTSIRYDSNSDTCVDSDGNTYEIDRDSKDTDDQGNVFYWHCTGDDGMVYTYSTQNRVYGYNYYDNDVDLVYSLTGKYPAIQGFDFGSYCPCYCWDDGVAGRMIEWTNEKGGICTASWHINVPTTLADYTLGEPLDFSKTTYSNKTDFVTANCLVEGTVEYEYFKLCMANLANELLKLQDAGVPVIFRPFHEAEGNPSTTDDPTDGSGAWFWWAKEGADVYKQLWNYLQDTLQNEYGLHNLIWEENLYAWSDYSAEWYVGDDRTDLVAYDKYNTQYNRHDGKTSGPNLDAEAGIFYKLIGYVDNHKMVAMAENDSIPSLENMLVEHAYWLYFCPWYDSGDAAFVSGENYQDHEAMSELYNSEFCITLDELPTDLFKGSSPITTTTTTTTVTKTTTTTTGQNINVTLYGDANCNGTIEMADAVLVLQAQANPDKYGENGTDDEHITEEGAANADCSGSGDGLTAKDALAIQKYLLKLIQLPEE